MNISNAIRSYGAYVSLLAITIFVYPEWFLEFGEIGWILLLIIMFSKPIYDIAPKLTWVGKILPFRRQLGIICGSFILAHGIGAYMIGYKITLQDLSNPSNFLLWGALWVLVMLPVLITSNNIAVRLLKKRWKIVQRLAYFFFIFWALHIYLIEKSWWILIMIIVWILLKLLAANKVVIWKK